MKMFGCQSTVLCDADDANECPITFAIIYLFAAVFHTYGNLHPLEFFFVPQISYIVSYIMDPHALYLPVTFVRMFICAFVCGMIGLILVPIDYFFTLGYQTLESFGSTYVMLAFLGTGFAILSIFMAVLEVYHRFVCCSSSTSPFYLEYKKEYAFCVRSVFVVGMMMCPVGVFEF
uniref:Uncharacterized protein n=1 Tax=Panagrellus redivivus TaxID=6233 RepID=A0A7E4ZSU7_PANRE